MKSLLKNRLSFPSVFFFLLTSSSVSQFWNQAWSQEPQPVVMLFGGDVTLANFFEKDIGDQLSYPFAKASWLKTADVTMVNLENPITQRVTPVPKEFNFRCNPKYVPILKDAGIDIVNLANNHIYDYGEGGVFDTIELLDSLGIKHVGAGRNSSTARLPVIIDIRGVRIGLLGYFDSVKTAALCFATDSIAGPANLNIDSLCEDIASIRSSVDCIVVNFHWGIEGSHQPTARQIALAHQVIDVGADVVIGHHPHVFQGIERYHNKVIAYSLGNFVFGGNSHSTYTTALLKITLAPAFHDQICADLLPIYVFHWQPVLLPDGPATAVIRQVEEYSSGFQGSIFIQESQ